MKLLDLFCGGGGAAMGYHRAGFEVVGVDIDPHPEFPFEFHQADALTFSLEGFDAAHASPPCQAYSAMRALSPQSTHPDLVSTVRERLLASNLPFVIENVVGSPLIDPIQLCGSSFALRIRRHRLFESTVPLTALQCDHAWQNAAKKFRIPQSKARGGEYLSGVVPVQGHAGQLRGVSAAEELKIASDAMGIDWMNRKALTQAIPPAYTEYIGKQLIASL